MLTAEKQDNVFFIVMEYVAGETLENIIGREGALEMTRALDFTCQICNAVDHAHRQGVLHRDLRPANIMVADNGLVKVADFGTSRFLELAAIGTTVIGSPPYMAPEQFHGTRDVRVGHLLARRDDVPDDDGHAAVPDAGAGRPRAADARRAGVAAAHRGTAGSRSASTTSSSRRWRPRSTERYQRAADVLEDLLGAPTGRARRRTDRASGRGAGAGAEPAPAQAAWPKPRESPQPRFCWNCNKPLHARTDRCPFCGEAQ